MITLGISGGMGSGKSYVCRILFALHDIPIFYSDIEVKKLFNDTSPNVESMREKLIELCGAKAYGEDKMWNIKHISELVETDKSLLDKITYIVEPYLIDRVNEFKRINGSQQFCAIESALFPKSQNFIDTVDSMVLVTAPLVTRIKRIKQRDPNRTDNEIITLLYNQLGKPMNIDYTLTNDIDEEVDLDIQIDNMLKTFTG